MLLEFALVFSCVALAVSLVTLMSHRSLVAEQKDALRHLRGRIYYMEVVASYHDLAPLPWEMEEGLYVEDQEKATKHFKREGNVIYLED